MSRSGCSRLPRPESTGSHFPKRPLPSGFAAEKRQRERPVPASNVMLAVRLSSPGQERAEDQPARQAGAVHRDRRGPSGERVDRLSIRPPQTSLPDHGGVVRLSRNSMPGGNVIEATKRPSRRFPTEADRQHAIGGYLTSGSSSIVT